MEGELLAQVDSGGNIFYAHNSQVSLPQKMTNASRTIVWDQIIEPFGEVQSTPTSATPTNIRFPGQYVNANNSLFYNNARSYDPTFGYVEADPIGHAGGLNLYAYATQNPTQIVDPFGLAGIGHNGGPPLYSSAPGLMSDLLSGTAIGLMAFFSDIKPTNCDESEAIKRQNAEYMYQQTGWSQDKIAGHMGGIDFNQPVTIEQLPVGTEVLQYQTPGSKAGNYFVPANVPKGTIGVSQASRVGVRYVTTEPVNVLRSTAADTRGSGSLPPALRGNGGGIQYFAPNTSAFRPVR